MTAFRNQCGLTAQTEIGLARGSLLRVENARDMQVKLSAKSRETARELDALARRSAGSNGFGAPEAAAPQKRPTYEECRTDPAVRPAIERDVLRIRAETYRLVIRRLVAVFGLK